MKRRKRYVYKPENDDVILLESGKFRFRKLLFNSAYSIIISLLLQIILLVALVLSSRNLFPFLFSGYMLFALIIVLIIVNRSGNPLIKLTWSVLILTLPVFGGLLYLYVDLQLGNRLMNKRLRKLKEHTKEYICIDPDAIDFLADNHSDALGLANYLKAVGDFPAYSKIEAEYYSSGENYFEHLIKELEKAERFIFIEYFIIKEGYMWGRVLKILSEKVRQGVEVRVMYDGLCAVSSLSYQYPKRLRRMGIKCKMFAPIYPILSTHYNNRDHRKIVVIDGRVAFTGGINLADEYINRYQPYGHWKDCGVMIKGDAVKSFTAMFLNIWNSNEKTEDFKPYLQVYGAAPVVENGALTDSGVVVPYSDSPVDRENVGECVYLDMINRAKRYAYFMTPYLILDNEMLTALTFAAKRGVDVRIILPHIPDKKYAFALAKSHYPELINAGIKIYEYLPGFVHAKVAVVDDREAVVGSINLDFRSLYLHYECAAFFASSKVISSVKADFDETLGKCKEIGKSDLKTISPLMKLYAHLLKIFAPLM